MARLRRMLASRRHPPHRRGAQSLRARLSRQRHDGVGRRRRAHRRARPAVGALDFVTPLLPPPARACRTGPTTCSPWCMAATRAEVERQGARRSRGLLGDGCRGHEILYSTRILKKTGLRLAA